MGPGPPAVPFHAPEQGPPISISRSLRCNDLGIDLEIVSRSLLRRYTGSTERSLPLAKQLCGRTSTRLGARRHTMAWLRGLSSGLPRRYTGPTKAPSSESCSEHAWYRAARSPGEAQKRCSAMTTCAQPSRFWGSPAVLQGCLLYTSPSPRDKRQSRMPSSA